MSVLPIGPAGLTQAAAAGETALKGSSAEVPFSRVLTDLVEQTQERQAGIGVELERIVTGEVDGVHDLVTSVAQADLAFRLVMEIRDRLIASYQEIMRMQV